MSYFFHYLFIHVFVLFCFVKLINLDSNKKVTDILECEFKSDDGALCRYHPEGVNIFVMNKNNNKNFHLNFYYFLSFSLYIR